MLGLKLIRVSKSGSRSLSSNNFNTFSMFSNYKKWNWILVFIKLNSLRQGSTHWGKMTPYGNTRHSFHYWFNGLSPVQHQAIAWINIANWTPRNKLQRNLNWDSNFFIEENAFETDVCHMSAILFLPPDGDSQWHSLFSAQIAPGRSLILFNSTASWDFSWWGGHFTLHRCVLQRDAVRGRVVGYIVSICKQFSCGSFCYVLLLSVKIKVWYGFYGAHESLCTGIYRWLIARLQ